MREEKQAGAGQEEQEGLVLGQSGLRDPIGKLEKAVGDF